MSASTSKSIATEGVFPHSFPLVISIVAFGCASVGLAHELLGEPHPTMVGLMAAVMFATTLIGLGATARLAIDYYFHKKKA